MRYIASWTLFGIAEGILYPTSHYFNSPHIAEMGRKFLELSEKVQGGSNGPWK